MTVKFIKMPGDAKELELNEGATVEALIEEAQFNLTDDWELRLNGEDIDNNDLDKTLSDGDQLVAVKRVEAA